MNAFSLNHLSDMDFEEFCFDLLGNLDFKNIQWRKGTGLETSPSDRGRDIECQIERIDVDGNHYLETWFVECKHYIKGVPPTHIQSALAWATAEKPDTLLIIASNFLSNPTKDYLKILERENKPRFKLKVWERPDIERLTLGKSRLLRKYNVVGDFPFLSILHPAHLLYIKGLQFNSMDYFFEVTNSLDPDRRDQIFSWVYEPIIQPRYRRPITHSERIKDLRIDPVSYEIFKNKCYEMVEKGAIDQLLLIFLIVNWVLHGQLGISDVTSVDEVVDRMRGAQQFFQRQTEEQTQNTADLERLIEFIEERILNAQNNTSQNYELYTYFCDAVVSKLLVENIFRSDQAVDN